MMVKVIILSLLAEAIWENLRMTFEDGKFSINRLGALIISIVVAVGTKINIFEILDFEMFSILGSILTGVLISRGANVVHDLLKKIQNLSETKTNLESDYYEQEQTNVNNDSQEELIEEGVVENED